jgi:hypothetical protein
MSLVLLEQALQGISHSDEALRTIQEFAEKLKGTNERLQLFNAEGALVRSPLYFEVHYPTLFSLPHLKALHLLYKAFCTTVIG